MNRQRVIVCALTSQVRSTAVAVAVSVIAVVALGFELSRRECPWLGRAAGIREELVGDASIQEAVLLTDVLVGLRLLEGLEAGVEDVRHPGTFLVHREGRATHSVLVHASVDVSELGAESAPHFTVPLGGHVGVVALVAIGLVSVDPNGVNNAVKKHGKTNIVIVFESEIFLDVASIRKAGESVGFVVARVEQIVVDEVFHRAIVLHVENTIGSRGPARDVDNIDATEVALG